jgi:hypothetical protein
MFKTGAVCAATNMPPAMLGRWQDRNTLKPTRHDEVSTGSGVHRLWCRASVHRIALAKHLTDLGIGASGANRAAALFNGLNEFGTTYLILKPTGARIVTGFNDSLTELCGQPFTGAIIVDVGQIVKAVDQALISKERSR